MAAFSFQQQNYPLFLDSVFYSNPPNNITNNNNNSLFLPQFYQLENLPHYQGMTSMDFNVHESSSSLEHSNNNNGTSVTNKQSPTASSSLVQLESGEEQVTQKLLVNPIDKKRKYKNGPSLNSAQSKNTREVKGKNGKKQKKIINGEVEEDKKGKEKKKIGDDQEGHPLLPPTGYIHVRARRGQATDSHSLAERVRREKISERMKLLQAIVPGCDKVTGKALMLDEIINYVQSLQNQVEFLSMRLASVNPMLYDFGVDLDAFMVKPENLSSLEPQMQNTIQEYIPTGSGNTFTTPNNYPLVDSSTSAGPSLLLQQGQQIHNILSQGNGQVLWGVDGQRQNLINQSSTLSNNLCSFH